MVTGMFCYRFRAGIDLDEYQSEAFRMFELVSGNPAFGFVGLKVYAGDDGENVLIAEFESVDGLEAWRDDPEHLIVQERGRTDWFESYWVAELTPRAHFDRNSGRSVSSGATR